MRFTQRLALKYARTKFKLLSSISKRKAAEKAFILFCTPQHRNIKPLPSVFSEAEQLSFDFQQYRISGYRWNAGSTEKVLILHGFESASVNFDRFVKPLVKMGYQVLAFDAPAHGRSTGRNITVVIYRQFIEYILNQYGPIKSFISHSFGGLTLSLVLEELPHDETFRVVMIAPACETRTAIDNFFGLLKLDDDVRREFDEHIYRLGGKKPEWYSVARAAQRIRATVLFLQDEQDHMTPLRDVEPIIRMNYPNFIFRITRGLGHRRIYRDAGIVNEIIDFFRK